MGIVIRGAVVLKSKMRDLINKIPAVAKRTLDNSADNIVTRAKLFCPVDTHALEQSIHKDATSEVNGRLSIDIKAGEELDYAMRIHENYESLKPGPGTVEKRLNNPDVYIGSHFVTRAVEEEREKLPIALSSAIRSVIAGGE